MNEKDRMYIEQACTGLVNRFAVWNDAREYEKLAELFSADAAFARPTDPDSFIHGRDNILKAFQGRPTDRVIRHTISNIVIDVENETSASGLCYAVQYTGDPDRPAEKFGLRASSSRFVGEFHDRFELTAAGWKIARRSGRIIFTV